MSCRGESNSAFVTTVSLTTISSAPADRFQLRFRLISRCRPPTFIEPGGKNRQAWLLPLTSCQDGIRHPSDTVDDSNEKSSSEGLKPRFRFDPTSDTVRPFCISFPTSSEAFHRSYNYLSLRKHLLTTQITTRNPTGCIWPRPEERNRILDGHRTYRSQLRRSQEGLGRTTTVRQRSNKAHR